MSDGRGKKQEAQGQEQQNNNDKKPSTRKMKTNRMHSWKLALMG